jgi:transposase-like protein
MNRSGPSHVLSEPQFHSEDAAYVFCEARLWPTGPVCPHCRCTGGKVGKLNGKSTRRGTYKCYECELPFTVKIGTVFERSHLELHLWLQTIYLLSFAKRRISVRQLQQALGIALKTAWVLHHRIGGLIARDDGPLLSAGKHRSAELGEAAAAANTAVAASAASSRTQAPAGASRREPRRKNLKRRVKRRPLEPDTKQLTLF